MNQLQSCSLTRVLNALTLAANGKRIPDRCLNLDDIDTLVMLARRDHHPGYGPLPTHEDSDQIYTWLKNLPAEDAK